MRSPNSRASSPSAAQRAPQHLKGLVVDRQAGKHRIYQVDRDGLGALRAELDLFWNKTLAAYKEAVERRDEEVS